MNSYPIHIASSSSEKSQWIAASFCVAFLFRIRMTHSMPPRVVDYYHLFPRDSGWRPGTATLERHQYARATRLRGVQNGCADTLPT